MLIFGNIFIELPPIINLTQVSYEIFESFSCRTVSVCTGIIYGMQGRQRSGSTGCPDMGNGYGRHRARILRELFRP